LSGIVRVAHRRALTFAWIAAVVDRCIDIFGLVYQQLSVTMAIGVASVLRTASTPEGRRFKFCPRNQAFLREINELARLRRSFLFVPSLFDRAQEKLILFQLVNRFAASIASADKHIPRHKTGAKWHKESPGWMRLVPVFVAPGASAL
jgi:hypothetical protein